MGPPILTLIVAVEQGDALAAEALFAALYSELHPLAKRELARRGLMVILSPTTLLHEAYLDMAARNGPSFPDCGRFMGYAARVMRGLIIDQARVRHAQKRGARSRLLPSTLIRWRTQLTTESLSDSAKHWTNLAKWSRASPRSAI